jgi:hypothetical protein
VAGSAVAGAAVAAVGGGAAVGGVGGVEERGFFPLENVRVNHDSFAAVGGGAAVAVAAVAAVAGGAGSLTVSAADI